MNHARTRRVTAGAVATTLLLGGLALLAVAPAQANHGARTLQVIPEISSGMAGGPGITLTAKLSSVADKLSPIRIAFEVEGSSADSDGANTNTADKFCTVAAEENSCTATFTGSTASNGLVRAWIDHDQKDGTDPDGIVEADIDEGRLSSNLPVGGAADCRIDEPSEASPDVCLAGTVAAGNTSEPDDTDVVQITFGGGVKSLDCVDSNPLNGSDFEVNPRLGNETYTCRAFSPSGAPLANAAIDGENLGGPNDPDDNAATPADYDTTGGLMAVTFCRTDASGVCTGTVSAAEGESGSGNATLCFWIDQTTENNTYAAAGADEDGGNCSEGIDENDGDPTDTVSIGWRNTAPAATSVDVSPETAISTAGTTTSINAVIYDQFGDRFAGGSPVRAELFAGSAGDTDGNNLATSDSTCTASGADNCNLSFTSPTSGASRVCTYIGAAPVLAGTSTDGTCDGENLADGTLNGRDVTRIVWSSAAGGGGTGTTPTTQPTAEDTAKTQGYTLVGADGGIFNYGTSTFFGSTGDIQLNKPVIGLASKKGGTGYWLVASDGGIFTFGDAGFFGSTGDKKLNAPILGMEATPSGNGYWLFAADGGIFTFGDATFQGSTGDMKLNAPVVGMAVTEKGNGYWLVARDGGIFTFNAPFHGSTGSLRLNEPVFDMGSTPGDKGYWLVARDGGIFSFGDAENKFYGSAVGATSAQVIGLGVTPTGDGYWIADSRGAVFPFGDARFLGDRRDAVNNAATVGFATVPKK